jgi:hypothetical protein
LRILFLPALEVLSERTKSFIQEYKRESPAEQVSEFYIIGKGAAMRGLGMFLEEKFSMPHLFLNPIEMDERIEVDVNLDQEAISELSLLLASLYPPIKGYDFFPPQYKIRRETYRIRNKILLYTGALALIFTIFYLGVRVNLVYLKKIRRKAMSVYEELLPVVQKVDLVSRLEDEVKFLETGLSQIYSRYPDWVGILKELSSITPKEIVLEEIESATEGGRDVLFIRGNVIADIGFQNLVLNQFIQNLEASQYFTEIKLTKTKQLTAEYVKQLYFELICYLD